MSTAIVVRPRPLFSSEILRNCKNVLMYPQTEDFQALIAGKKIFEYDRVLTENSSQAEVFEVIKPVVHHVCSGYHATVLAYGQTGTGKTYTMGTSQGHEANSNDESQGLVPRMITSLFENAVKQDLQISVKFMEVYNEEVYDLLAEIPTKLQVKGFKVPNLTEKKVYSESEALMRLDEGIDARRYCATQANSNSSRSHAVFSLLVRRNNENGSFFSQLHLVDLAGSESVKKTGNQGAAFQEGVNINKGLLALGNVIAALGNNMKHVPYRDSTLTEVLKDSLSGNCYVTIIACVSPSDADLLETLSTLRFVQRAKKIVNQPKINKILQDHSDKLKDFPDVPATPIWKVPSAAGRKVKGTPGSLKRKPLTVMNYSTPSPFTPRPQDKMMLSSISETGHREPFMTDRDSPTFNLPNLTFEPPRCSSTLSFFNNDQDVSILMNTLISEKMEELLLQTEQLVERKVQDTIQKMRSTRISPLASQLKRCSQVLGIPSGCIEQGTSPIVFPASASTPTNQDNLAQKSYISAAKCKLFQSPVVVESLELERRQSPRLQAKYEAAVKVQSPESQVFTAKTSTQSGPTVEPCFDTQEIPNFVNIEDSPEHYVMPKRRRSVRIGEMTNQMPVVASPPQVLEQSKIRKSRRKSSRLSLKNHQSLNISSSFSQQTLSPGMTEFLKDMSFHRPSSRRLSVAVSACMADVSQQTSPELTQVHSQPRRSMSLRQTRKSLSVSQFCQSSLLLEESIVEPSNSVVSSAQDKHNKSILKLLNKGTLRSLQQLPTIGPKTAFIIFNYRKLNGTFKTLNDLEKVPGLAKTYLKRFLQANNVVL